MLNIKFKIFIITKHLYNFYWK